MGKECVLPLVSYCNIPNGLSVNTLILTTPTSAIITRQKQAFDNSDISNLRWRVTLQHHYHRHYHRALATIWVPPCCQHCHCAHPNPWLAPSPERVSSCLCSPLFLLNRHNTATTSLCSPVSTWHCRIHVPIRQGLCSSLSDAMWNAPSCHQTQYLTSKTHRAIITCLPLPCQHFPWQLSHANIKRINEKHLANQQRIR